MITLAETKNYLRVDHTEDDKAIKTLKVKSGSGA